MLMCIRNMNDARIGVPQELGLSLTATAAATTVTDCVPHSCHQQQACRGIGSFPQPQQQQQQHHIVPILGLPSTNTSPPAATTTPTTTATTTPTAGMVVDLSGFLHREHCRATAGLSRGQIALLPVRLTPYPAAEGTVADRPDPVGIGPAASMVPMARPTMCPAHTMVWAAQQPQRVVVPPQPNIGLVSHCACCPLSLSSMSRDSGFSDGVMYCDAFQLITTPIMSSDANRTNSSRVGMATQPRQRCDATATSGGHHHYYNSGQLPGEGTLSNRVGSPQSDCIICQQQQQQQIVSYTELLRHHNQHHQQQQNIQLQQQITCHHCSAPGQALPSMQLPTISSSSGVYENLAQTHIPRIVCHSPGLNGEIGLTPATTDSGISSPTLPDQSNTTTSTPPPSLSSRPDFHQGGVGGGVTNLQSRRYQHRQQQHHQHQQQQGPLISTNVNIDHVFQQDLRGGCGGGGGGSPTFQPPSPTSSASDDHSSTKTAMSSLSFGSDFGSDMWSGQHSSSPSDSSGDSSGDCSGLSVASWAQRFKGATENELVWNTLKESSKWISKCGFYYGRLSMEDAKQKLKSLPVGSFLLRDSSNKHYLFSLSAKTPRGVTSVRIEYQSALFRLDSDEKSASQMPGFDCVLKLIQHYVQLSENKRAKKCVWLESSGRNDTPVMLTRPVTECFPSLTHLCRKVIHKTFPMKKMTQNLKTDFKLLEYLQDYPYYV